MLTGREEIYYLNTNSTYSGQATNPDKLFKWGNGLHEDIFSEDSSPNPSTEMCQATLLACVDRLGIGRYEIYLANYAGHA